jgi:hypothetical protein
MRFRIRRFLSTGLAAQRAAFRASGRLRIIEHLLPPSRLPASTASAPGSPSPATSVLIVQRSRVTIHSRQVRPFAAGINPAATMASADFWRSISAPFDADSTRQIARSPRVLRTHLHAYACRIYAVPFRTSIGLCISWPAHPGASPLSASCSSGQRFAHSFLRIPSRPGHPCRSANTSPCRVCGGLSPLSGCALPGAPKKGPLRMPGGPSVCARTRARQVFNRFVSMGRCRMRLPVAAKMALHSAGITGGSAGSPRPVGELGVILKST